MKSLCLSLLLLSLTAFGQAFTPRRPFILQSAVVNTNPSAVLPYGMLFWYNSRDLSNSPVSEWVDRIQSYYWWQTNATLQPTWTTNVGVHFDGTQQFLNASNSYILPSEFVDAMLCVFQFDDTTQNRMLMCQSYGGGTIVIGKAGTPDYLYNANIGAGAVGPIGTSTMDLICSPKSFQKWWITTNGISGQDETVPWNHAILSHVGSGVGNGYANVTLKEFIVWTNINAGAGTTNYWSSTTISNVHWYATNQWGGSP